MIVHLSAEAEYDLETIGDYIARDNPARLAASVAEHRVIADAIAALEPAPTLVVTHGGPMRAALHLLCGLELRQTWAFDLPYAAGLALRVWEGAPRQAQVIGLRP